ncbi:MAG: hypothetical protein AAFR53_03850 [Pseudomonadota bacterium]
MTSVTPETSPEAAARVSHPVVNAALIVPFILFAVAFLAATQVVQMNEDAAILFRYSANLAETGVISYNPGGVPVEGATDFLFMVVIGGLAALGLDPYAGAILLNIAAFGAILALLDRLFRLDMLTALGVVAAFVAMAPFSAAAAGFSVIVFLAAILACITFAHERALLPFALSALICCLIRPDGFVFAAPLTLLVVAQHLREPRAYATLIAALVIPGIAYFLWRWSYFGEFLPLPFYVKAEVERDIFGLFYSGSIPFFLQMAVPLLIGLTAALIGARDGRRPILTVLAVALVPAFCFYLAMHLIQNLGNRFLAFIPLIAVVAIANVALPWLRVAMLAVLALSMVPDARSHMGYLAQETNDHHIAAGIGTLEAPIEMAVTEAGHLAYHSGAQVLDLWGLNSPEFARMPATGEDMLGREFDLIALHFPGIYDCAAMAGAHQALWSGPVWQRSDATMRDWGLMVQGVLSGIDPSDYALFEVPIFVPADSRHFMYLVHTDRPQAEAIVGLLEANNARAC